MNSKTTTNLRLTACAVLFCYLRKCFCVARIYLVKSARWLVRLKQAPAMLLWAVPLISGLVLNAQPIITNQPADQTANQGYSDKHPETGLFLYRMGVGD
jgi:hypothetical protein